MDNKALLFTIDIINVKIDKKGTIEIPADWDFNAILIEAEKAALFLWQEGCDIYLIFRYEDKPYKYLYDGIKFQEILTGNE